MAFSQSHDDLAAYLGDSESFAAQASPETRKIFDANDLVVWANVPKLSAGLDKTIDDFQTEITGMLELTNVTNNQTPMAGAVQKEAVGMVFSFVKEFLKDAQSSMVTARLTDSGATLGLVGDFVPDSSIGKFVAAQKSSKAISFQGLPTVTGNNFLMAGAFNWDKLPAWPRRSEMPSISSCPTMWSPRIPLPRISRATPNSLSSLWRIPAACE